MRKAHAKNHRLLVAPRICRWQDMLKPNVLAPFGCGSKPMVEFCGRCTTHFRTHFSGWIGMFTLATIWILTRGVFSRETQSRWFQQSPGGALPWDLNFLAGTAGDVDVVLAEVAALEGLSHDLSHFSLPQTPLPNQHLPGKT